MFAFRGLARAALVAFALALLAGCSSGGHSSSPTSPTGSTGSSGSWTLFTVDSSSSDVGEYAHLAADSAGHLAISYLNGATGQVRCARRVAGSWSISDLGTGAGPYVTSGRNSIALKSDGSPVVLFHRADIAYFWTAWTGSAWTAPTGITWSESAWAFLGGNAIAIPPGSNTAIGALSEYDSHAGGDLTAWSSTGSTATRVDGSSSSGTGTQVSAAADAAGRLHVAYEYEPAANVTLLKYGRLDGGTWTASIVDTLGDGGYATSSLTAIAVDPSGAPGIVYYGGHGGYYYAHWNGASWDRSLIDSYGSVGLVDESIAYDRSGNPHIALLTGYYRLKYAHRVSGVWTEETVDATTGVGCSIGVEGSGKVDIAYYDDVVHRLRLAVRTP